MFCRCDEQKRAWSHGHPFMAEVLRLAVRHQFHYARNRSSYSSIATSATLEPLLGPVHSASQSVQSTLKFLSKANSTYHSMWCSPDVLHQACNWGMSQPTMAYRNTQSPAYKMRSTRIVSLRSTWCTHLIAIANPSPPKKDFQIQSHSIRHEKDEKNETTTAFQKSGPISVWVNAGVGPWCMQNSKLLQRMRNRIPPTTNHHCRTHRWKERARGGWNSKARSINSSKPVAPSLTCTCDNRV